MSPHPVSTLPTSAAGLVRYFWLLASLAALALPLSAQDPGSMASKVNKPAVCGDAQILKFNATSGLFECQDEGAGGGSGDNLSVNSTAAADANFIDSATISFSLNPAPTPDEVSAAVLANALGPAHLDETANYLFSGSLFATGALTCGAGAAGRARVHTTPFQYCDNAATPALRYAAFGDATGNALSGDSATAFFATGALEAARLPNLESLNGLLDVPGGGTGSAPAADDQILVSDSISTATWRSVPACANSATDKLLYDAATNSFACAADQNSGGAPAWENLINGADAATLYTGDSAAETLTFDFTSAFTAGSRFLVRQQTGNPTGGNLAEFAANDADVTSLRLSNTAVPAASWLLYAGDNRASFSPLSQAYLDQGFSAFGRLNTAGGSKNTALTGVVEDNTTGSIFALYGEVNATHSAGTKPFVAALSGDAYNSGAGNVTNLYGIGGFAEQDGAGAVSSMIAIRAFTNARTAGTVAENIGIHIGSQVGIGTDNWALRSEGGLVEVNTGDAATVGLAVRGAAAQTAHLQEWQDSTGSVLAGVTSGGAMDSTAGYQVNGAAVAGRYLRGDGANFVPSAVAAAGAGACANQFVRALNDNAAPTCATVTRDDLADPLRTAQITYTFFDPAADLPTTLDVPSVYANRARAITLTEVYCEIDAGSASINLQRDDGAPANILSSDLACSTAGATSTAFVAGENSLALGHNLDHVTVSAGAGLRRLSIAVKYTID